MVYIKGLVGFLLVLRSVFARDAWQKVSPYLKDRAGLAAAFLLVCSGIALAVLIPGRDLNFLIMENPVSWTLTAWFSSITILMFGERVSACGGSWKEWPVFGWIPVPFSTYYGTYSLAVMYTHLTPVIAFFKVATGRMIYPGVSGSMPRDILLLVLVLAMEPGVVWLIETRLPWINGRKRRSK